MNEQNALKQLRAFGLIVGGVFLFISLWPFLFRNPEGPRYWAFALGALLMLQGLVLPQSLGPIYRVWMKLGHALGWVNTRLILAVFYFTVITPIGLLRRLFGKDALSRTLEPNLESYRVKKSPREGKHMMRQF